MEIGKRKYINQASFLLDFLAKYWFVYTVTARHSDCRCIRSIILTLLMLFREFLTAFVVEMYCDEFEKHTMVQIYSNFFTKNCYMRYWIQISSDTKLPQTFPDSKVADSYSICDNFVSDSCSLV